VFANEKRMEITRRDDDDDDDDDDIRWPKRKRVTKLRCTLEVEETHSAAAGLTDKVYVELPLRELTRRGKETNNEER